MTMRCAVFHAVVTSFVGLFVLAGPSAQAQQPRAAQGVYATIDISDYVQAQENMGNPVNDATVSAYYDTMLGNAAISGLDIELHWDFAEQNPPPVSGLTAADLTNINYVNDAFTEAAKYGKTIKLDVTAGFNSPTWLLNFTTNPATALRPCDTLFTTGTAPMGCGTVTFNYYGENTDQDTTNQVDQMLILPLPWNTTYLDDWEAFLTVLQQQYGSNPLLVDVTMAGPTAASPEMIMPSNYNTCANAVGNNPPANQGAHNLCYTCPINKSPPCTAGNGTLAEDMWNTLFTNSASDQGAPFPQSSDAAFVAPWKREIQFYESTFQGITLTLTPGSGTSFPSFSSGHPFTPSTGNVLYDPECNYSNSGGTTSANNNYATASCDAATYLLSYFMNTAGGPGPVVDGMASQTSGMEAQDPTALGNAGDGNTGDVGVPGVKYLAAYSEALDSPQQQVIGGAQFDHQFSEPTFTAQEGCPQGPNGCPGITPEQAEYNVLQVFFLGTPGGIRFGSANPSVLSVPTPRYLEAFQQDITYAEKSTSVAQPIVDVMTGQTYQMSAQDMLNMAKASLFGRLAAHDYSNDGRSDILWRDSSGNLAIWEMNGSAIFNENASGLGGVSTAWTVVGQRDFNGDGYADILWRDTAGDLAIWEMSGIAVLNANASGLGNVPTNWSVVGTGDFNGDGNADILWRDTAGDLAIWEMNGTKVTNTNSAGVGNVATNWSVAGVGDFNGDGKADILWRNTNNGNVAIWEMNGTTILNSTTFGNMPLTWSVVGTGDFNGDGMTDILWRDTSGNIAIWEMSGTTILNQNNASVGNLSTVWSVAETGDFNADGLADILWRDTSGDIAIWFMNGTTITSGTGLGTIATTFTIQGTNAD
jgi:hypothetical protein